MHGPRNKIQRISLGFLWIMTAVNASILVYVSVEYLSVPNKFSRAALQFFLKYWRALKSSLIEVMALKHMWLFSGWFGLKTSLRLHVFVSLLRYNFWLPNHLCSLSVTWCIVAQSQRSFYCQVELHSKILI
jgi:hypothetical protein